MLGSHLSRAGVGAIVFVSLVVATSIASAHADDSGVVTVTAQARPRLECTPQGDRGVLVRSNVRWRLQTEAEDGSRTEVRGGKTAGRLVRLPSDSASFSLMHAD